MVWNNLSVNGVAVKYTNIKVDEQEHQDCDKDGNPVEKHYLDDAGKRTARAFRPYKWIGKDGQECPKAYKLINGKVADKLSRTKEIKADVVDVGEARDLMSEQYYAIEGELPLKEGQAFKFVFTNGNGYKVYRAYIFSHKGKYVMVAGKGFLSNQIEKVSTAKASTKKKAKALFDDGVAQAQAGELLVE